MTDTRKEFERAVSNLGWAFDYIGDCQYGSHTIQFANKLWQACQSLNDKRIEQLLAVIAKKDEALSAVDDLIEHQYCGSKDAMTDLQIACDMTYEALALQPSDVELVEVGVVDWDYDQGGMATCQYANITQSFKIKPATKLYTIKTKADKK